MAHTTRYVGRLLRPGPLEPTLLLSASQLQPHMHPLHRTFIQLRINLRYVALVLPVITCANDSSGSMPPLTPVSITAFPRPIKALRNKGKLCTATSHSTEIGPVCHSHLMPVTGEPTRMRSLAEDWLGWLTRGVFQFGRLICILKSFQCRFVFRHVRARRLHRVVNRYLEMYSTMRNV
jgi:hypothetical protein